MLELIQPAVGLWRRAAYTFALYSPLSGVEGKRNKFRNVLAVAIYLKVNKMFIRRGKAVFVGFVTESAVGFNFDLVREGTCTLVERQLEDRRDHRGSINYLYSKLKRDCCGTHRVRKSSAIARFG